MVRGPGKTGRDAAEPQEDNPAGEASPPAAGSGGRLSVEEAARLLDLPEKTVERWTRQGRIPFSRDGRNNVFDRDELLAWARHGGLIKPSPGMPPGHAVKAGKDGETLAAAIARGGVFHGVAVRDRAEALTEAVRLAPVPESFREEFLRLVTRREEVASTGIGRGAAAPHPVCPVCPPANPSAVTVVFLKDPVDFGADDGIPVFVLFLMLCAKSAAHLRLLSQLAVMLSDSDFVAILRTQPQADTLIAEIARREASLPGPAGPPGSDK